MSFWPSGPKILVWPLYLSGLSHSVPGGVLSLIPSAVIVWKGAKVKVAVSIA